MLCVQVSRLPVFLLRAPSQCLVRSGCPTFVHWFDLNQLCVHEGGNKPTAAEVGTTCRGTRDEGRKADEGQALGVMASGWGRDLSARRGALRFRTLSMRACRKLAGRSQGHEHGRGPPRGFTPPDFMVGGVRPSPSPAHSPVALSPPPLLQHSREWSPGLRESGSPSPG